MNAAKNILPLNPDNVSVGEWDEPQRLGGKIITSESYPIDALPSAIRRAVDDVTTTSQAPLGMVATGALTALSLAGQGLVDVARNSHLSGPVSLFALVLAESGERKSTVDSFFTGPIRRYEAAKVESMKIDVSLYQAEMASWAAEKAGLVDAIKQAAKSGKSTDEWRQKLATLQQALPEAPLVPEYIYSDATPEALAFGLAKVWPSAGVLTSEGGVVFGSHGMSADSIIRNLAIFNVLWDGGVHKASRRTTDSYIVHGARLTVSLQVQLAILAEFIRKTGNLVRGSGFLARFLVAWPETTQGKRLYREPDAHLPGLQAYDARLTQLLEQPQPFDETGHSLAPKLLQLDSDAKRVWVDFYNRIESQLAPLGHLVDVRDVAAKAADNAARIAALFHLYEYGVDEAIGAPHMDGACTIAWWHLNESHRLLTKLSQAPETSLAARLDGWLIEQCRDQLDNRISTKKTLQFSPVRKAAELDAILAELEVVSRACRVTEGRKKWIAVNPKLLDGVRFGG